MPKRVRKNATDFVRSATFSDRWKRTGSLMGASGLLHRYAASGERRAGSLEIRVALAVLGVLLPQPGVELAVVVVALLAAVGVGIVAQVQLPPPAVGQVRVGPVWGEPAEDRHVARLQHERHRRALVHDASRKFVVLAVFLREC